MRLASFFAGIGGFDLGFERAGFETVFQSEINPFSVAVLQKRWPEVTRHGDIRCIEPSDVPDADVWTGGFPCQDLSLARSGARLGLRGDRSGLFFEFLRLVRERTPANIVLENVPGLLSSHGGRDFHVLIDSLGKLGYGVAWRVLNSRHFGVPQFRQRLYIVGCHRDGRRAGQVLFEPERGTGHLAPGTDPKTKSVSPFRTVAGETVSGAVVPRLAYCLAATSGRHTGTDWSRTYVPYESRVRRLTPNECEGLQGFPKDWTLLPDYHLSPNDMDSLRYEALGNAVTVNINEWLGRRILSCVGSNNLARP